MTRWMAVARSVNVVAPERGRGPYWLLHLPFLHLLGGKDLLVSREGLGDGRVVVCGWSDEGTLRGRRITLLLLALAFVN